MALGGRGRGVRGMGCPRLTIPLLPVARRWVMNRQRVFLFLDKGNERGTKRSTVLYSRAWKHTARYALLRLQVCFDPALTPPPLSLCFVVLVAPSNVVACNGQPDEEYSTPPVLQGPALPCSAFAVPCRIGAFVVPAARGAPRPSSLSLVFLFPQLGWPLINAALTGTESRAMASMTGNAVQCRACCHAARCTHCAALPCRQAVLSG